jgi:F0F1-type ATP synthase membrane subunit a
LVFIKTNHFLIPSYIQLTIEFIFKFVLDLMKGQIGERGIKFFSLFFFIFMVILLLNLVSLTPLGFSPTSHII